jgi:hypothetical protein
VRVSSWGESVFGNPCRGCGFQWDIDIQTAVEMIRSIPSRYAALVGDRAGTTRIDALEWSSVEYVCHVTDNLRIWSERLAAASAGGSALVGTYDSDLLARARAYDRVPLQGALWSLGRAAEDWSAAITDAQRRNIVLNHPDRGAQTVQDVARNNTHDAIHHAWDIERIESAAAP